MLLVVVAACGNGEAAGQAQTRPPTSRPEPPEPVHDWATGANVELAPGWQLSACESGPPPMCARRDGQTLAVIELQSAPAASYPTIERILDGGGTADDALRAQAVEFQRIFAEDRPIGCGPDYTVAPFGPTSTTVAGHRGVV